MSKTQLIILTAFFICLVGFLITAGFLPSQEFVIANIIQEDDSTVTLLAVGDIMLDRGVEYMIDKYGSGDFRFPFFKSADGLDRADILFGNLETVISNKGNKVGSIYSFRSDLNAINGLKYAGFDILSLANNHMFDYQAIALEDTMIRLKQAGIEYVGAGFNAEEAFGLKIIEKKGVKVGFLAYTNMGSSFWRARKNHGTGMAWINQDSFPDLANNIAQAKTQVDILVVSFHGGTEYSHIPNSFQKLFAKTCILAGADLILGHHPHVIQPLQKYKNGWVVYSLGNFVFDQGFSVDTMQGLLLEVIIKNKKITQVITRGIKMNNLFQPEFTGRDY